MSETNDNQIKNTVTLTLEEYLKMRDELEEFKREKQNNDIRANKLLNLVATYCNVEKYYNSCKEYLRLNDSNFIDEFEKQFNDEYTKIFELKKKQNEEGDDDEE